MPESETPAEESGGIILCRGLDPGLRSCLMAASIISIILLMIDLYKL